MNNYEYTELRKCADPYTGPTYFLKNYFYVQHPVKGAILLGLHDFQEELVDSYIFNPFSINLISRQLGKSAVTSGYLLWDTIFKSDRTNVIGSYKHLAAIDIMARIRFGIDNLPDFLKPKCTTYNKTNLDFDNGSRIIAQAITETLGRGMAISTLYLDELAYARDTSSREAWLCLAPSFSTGTRVIITSTARYYDDFFAELWKGACHLENGFVPLSIAWDRHPDRTQAWANETIKLIGEARFRQEHENEFLIRV